MTSGFSLPAWIYNNPEFLALEKEQLFMRHWQLVCHISDIAHVGDYETFTLLDQDIIIIRDQVGNIGAFHNVCRHRGSRLLKDEKGNCAGRIVCPYHAWSYSSQGDLLKVPYVEQYENFEQGQHGLIPVECEVYLGFVFIRFGSGEETVREYMKPIADELDLYRMEEVRPLTERSTLEVGVNWKNGTDNYVDALHVRVAHGGLNSLLNTTYSLTQVSDGIHRLFGRVEKIVGRSSLAKRYHQCLPDVAHLPETHKRMWLYFMTWPNLAFNLYPDQIEFMQFLPLDSCRTTIRFGTYALQDDRPEMAEARKLNIELNNQVGHEDVALITGVQRGMNSGNYVRGPLGRNEVCLRGFADKMRRTIPVSQELQAPPVGQVALRNQALYNNSVTAR